MEWHEFVLYEKAVKYLDNLRHVFQTLIGHMVTQIMQTKLSFSQSLKTRVVMISADPIHILICIKQMCLESSSGVDEP